MRIQMRKASFRLVNTGDVAHWHPPQRDICAGELFEPRLPLAKQLGMSCAINIVAECVDGLPNRHIDEDAVVIIRTKIGGVSLATRPDKVCRLTFSLGFVAVWAGAEGYGAAPG